MPTDEKLFRQNKKRFKMYAHLTEIILTIITFGLTKLYKYLKGKQHEKQKKDEQKIIQESVQQNSQLNTPLQSPKERLDASRWNKDVK